MGMPGQHVERGYGFYASVAISAALAGCSAPARPTDRVDVAQILAKEDAELAANRACIITALNNTIYKRQGDDQLAAALSHQRLDRCGVEFQKAYGTMQRAALDYRITINAVFTAQGKRDVTTDKDSPHILCILLPGEPCSRSLPMEWDTVTPDLRRRAEHAKAAMEAGQIGVIEAAGASDVWGLFAKPSGDLKAGIEIIS